MPKNNHTSPIVQGNILFHQAILFVFIESFLVLKDSSEFTVGIDAVRLWAEETDKVSLISVSFLPPNRLDI